LLKEGFRSDASAEHSLDATAPSPASTGFEPPPIEQLAPLFPQLELLELIGKGGMGAVYKARQTGLDRLVAVKILPPEVGRDPAFAERFTREARAMARLSHPHIVAIYDFGQTHGQFYFVMEFIDGANLRQVIQSKQLTAAEALAVVPQICDALQYAHDEGIVHRDIKPENILVDKRGRVKIADFGLSKLLHEQHADVSLTGTHQVMGTLRYMAPEQMEGTKSVDHRADIYSLGVVFYELLTGQIPMGRFDPPSKKVQIDVRLDEVVLRALEQEPEKRYQQASEVKTELEGLRVGGSRKGDRHASSTKELPRNLRLQQRAAAIGLMIVGMLGMTLGLIGSVLAVGTWLKFYTNPPAFFLPSMGSILGMFGLLAAGAFVASAAGWLLRLRRYDLCVAGSVVAVVLGTLLVGMKQHVSFYLAILPGIYAFVVLQKQGIRDAFEPTDDTVAGEVKTKPETVRAAAGAPLANIRFVVNDAADVARLAKFHFSAKGYQLADEQADSLVFQRGSKVAGLWETDIRRYHTTLTVRTAPIADSKAWVSCDWSVVKMGSWVTRRDVSKLEAEGREFAILLHADVESNSALSATSPATPSRSGLAELAAVCVGLGILVPILLYVFTQDVMLTRIALVGGQALAMLLGLLSYRRPLGRYAMLLGVVVIGAYSGVQLYVHYSQTPITYPWYGDTGFIQTVDGPALSDYMRAKLGIPGKQVKEANRVFQDYYRQYEKLERKHTTYTRDADGTVHATIEPFPDEMFELAKNLRAELGGIVPQAQMPPMPEKGMVHTQLGVFRWAGEAKVAAILRRTDDHAGPAYHLREEIAWIEGARQGGSQVFESMRRDVSAFPERYRLYWVEPTDLNRVVTLEGEDNLPMPKLFFKDGEPDTPSQKVVYYKAPFASPPHLTYDSPRDDGYKVINERADSFTLQRFTPSRYRTRVLANGEIPLQSGPAPDIAQAFTFKWKAEGRPAPASIAGGPATIIDDKSQLPAAVSYFDGHSAEVQDVAVTADGQTIVSAGADGKIIARDFSGKLLGNAVSPVAEKSPSTAWLTSVAVTSSGSDAYAGDAKGIWHTKIGDAGPPRRLLNSADTVKFVLLYDGGSKLAYVDNTEIKYHDLQNKRDLAVVRLRPEKVGGYVRAAVASPSGRHIAVNSVEKDGDGAETYKLTVYDAQDAGAVHLDSLYLSYAEFDRALPVFLDDRTLVVCLPEGRLRRWTFADDRWQLDPTTVRIPPGFTAAAASRDGKILYLALPISSPGDKQRIVGLDGATGKRLVAADLEVGRQLGNNISWWINALATTDVPHQVVAALWDGRVAVAKCVPLLDAPPVAVGPASMIADKSQLPTVGQPGREDFAFVFKAPPGHVLTVWLELWENGKLTIPPECCERFASGKEEPLDVTLRLATQEGKVVNPDLSGKLRFDWALGEGKTDLIAARSVWLKSPEELFAPPSPEKPWKGGATTYRNHYIAGPPTNPLDACRVKVGTTKRLYSLTSYDKSKATEDQKKHGEVLSIPGLMEGWPTAAIFVRARIDAADSFPGNMFARETRAQLNLGDRRFTPALISLTRLAQDLGAEVQDATDESEVRIALTDWLAASDTACERAVALLKTKNMLAAASATADALAELLRESVASKAPAGPDTKADYEPLARGTWRPRFNVPAEVDGPAGTLKDGVIITRDFLMDRADKPVFFRDGIIRAKVEGFGSVHLRCTGDSYQLALMQDGLHIYKWQKDMPVKLASISPEALTKSDGFRELTFVALGSHLIGYLDGKRTIELIDHSIAGEGVVAIHAHQPPDKFKDVEVMSLDGVDMQNAVGGLEVLNQFVGTWNVEQTARPSQKHPDHTITGGKIATRWVLGGRYLRSDYDLGSNPGPIVLATYDPQRNEYPTWVFTPSGSVAYSPRKWNPADVTLRGNVVDGETGISVRCDDVLHTERSITRTLLVTNKDGRKIHDVSDRLLRAGDADLAAEPGETAAGPDADVPQLKVLAPLAGGFATESGMTDAAGKRHPSPAGRNQTRWIMRGRMLEERGLTPDGAADTHLCFWTYDADDEKYHHWFLPIFGSPASVAFEWDETARALDGRGTFQTGEKTTSRVQLADPDRIQWTMTLEASGSKALRFDGRLTRIKN